MPNRLEVLVGKVRFLRRPNAAIPSKPIDNTMPRIVVNSNWDCLVTRIDTSLALGEDEVTSFLWHVFSRKGTNRSEWVIIKDYERRTIKINKEVTGPVLYQIAQRVFNDKIPEVDSSSLNLFLDYVLANKANSLGLKFRKLKFKGRVKDEEPFKDKFNKSHYPLIDERDIWYYVNYLKTKEDAKKKREKDKKRGKKENIDATNKLLTVYNDLKVDIRNKCINIIQKIKMIDPITERYNELIGKYNLGNQETNFQILKEEGMDVVCLANWRVLDKDFLKDLASFLKYIRCSLCSPFDNSLILAAILFGLDLFESEMFQPLFPQIFIVEIGSMPRVLYELMPGYLSQGSQKKLLDLYAVIVEVEMKIKLGHHSRRRPRGNTYPDELLYYWDYAQRHGKSYEVLAREFNVKTTPENHINKDHIIDAIGRFREEVY